MLATEERTTVVSGRLRELTYLQAQTYFNLRFRKSGMVRVSIKSLVNKHKRIGSVVDEELPGRSSVPPENVQRVEEPTT